MRRSAVVAAAGALLLATPALAQMRLEAVPLAEGRPCVYADVVGLWEGRVERADEAGMAQITALTPRDYLRFRADGEMMYFGGQPLTDVAEINRRLDDLDRRDGESYRAEFPAEGVLMLRRNGAPFQAFTCTVAEPREGEDVLIWSEIRGAPALRRVQTRLE
jgi:hypothetical protein